MSFYHPTCPYCGEELDEEHTCEEQSPVAREDNCPMCGEPYDSWLDHLKSCEPG